MGASLWLGQDLPAQWGATVNVEFTTTNPTSLNLGFAGFTTEMLGKGEEYWDTNLQAFARQLSPGWLLFPAGTTGDAFNWQTGLTDTNWVNTITADEGANNPAGSLTAGTVQVLLGKGGVKFSDFAGMAGNLGGAKIIVCVNAFTDTTNSAGAFAAYALSNHIPVAAWELCNEPYLFQGTNDFFTNGTDYANKMRPYRDAIKSADSNAVVAVFFSDPARTGMSWDNDLAAYGATNQYWDAVAYHYYPQWPTNAAFSDLMALDNWILCSNSTMFVSNTLAKDSGTNTVFLLTEFNPGDASSTGTQNMPSSSLYGGVYAAEMVMRLSTCPRMAYAGSYQLLNGSGVDTTNDFRAATTKAASNGYVTNTMGLPFGFFLSAQGCGEAVAYWAINRSTAVYATSVDTNGPTVFTDTNGVGTMPAIYAQAYKGGNGKQYVLLTNKGTNATRVQVMQDGLALTNEFLETFITGADPTVVNVNPPSNNIVIQTATATNLVVIPEYSVVRLEWTAFDVPDTTLSLISTNGVQDLEWIGLTNVIYNVEGLNGIGGNWTTLGRVAGARTNFDFTDPAFWPARFYRLTVP